MTEHTSSWPPNLGPEVVTPIPGPESQKLVDDLARYECPAITARRSRRAAETGVDQDPIVWDRASGSNVWDVDGNRYVDLCGAFAVMSVGHAHPKVSEAARTQSERLIHAMGDVYPSRGKIELCRKLAEISPGDLQHVILGQSGASAVEAALKTAAIATGKPGVIAFQGAYHGLGYGALAATAYRKSFRAPFKAQLNPHVTHVPFPGEESPLGGGEEGARASLRYIEHLLSYPASGVEEIGAILFEPIQGRGGEVTPPAFWVQGLRDLCDRHGILLIADEIYTGFGRTGDWFACEHSGVVPDLLCVGKAMGGGFPISAVIGRPHVMEAWGESRGESIHTSTFLGNPLGCAMAIAAIDILQEERLVERSAALGEELRRGLEAKFPKSEGFGDIRGRGLMLGLPVLKEDGSPDGFGALDLVARMRSRGYLIMPSGVYGHVLGFAPPLVISREQLMDGVEVLAEEIRALRAS